MKLEKKPNPLRGELKRPVYTHDTICIYTDGGCLGNGKAVNTGAWAYVIVGKGHTIFENVGVEENTSNNQMELQAALHALEVVLHMNMTEPIVLHTDSMYLVQGVYTWRPGWEKKNYQDIKNKELWEDLFYLIDKLPNLHITWIKAHQTDDSRNTYYNNYVDDKCTAAINIKLGIEGKLPALKSPVATKTSDDLLVQVYESLLEQTKELGKYLKSKKLI